MQWRATEVAPYLLGARLSHTTDQGTVSVRITEVEAYLGPHDSAWPDPGSHTYRGKTPRNALMYGPAGHLYVYFTYGMHFCANIVCGPKGDPSACLIRAGEVVEGLELARFRRPTAKNDDELAKGPARLAKTMGISGENNGAELGLGPENGAAFRHGHAPSTNRRAEFHLELAALGQDPLMSTGPRVGVSGPGGSSEYPWRFWLSNDPSVSVFRAAARRAPRRP